MKIICKNKRAFFDYEILKKMEAGISLLGTEVKSIRANRVNLKGSFCRIDGEQLFVHQMHVSEYPQAGPFNHDPVRKRKLLLHKRELRTLQDEQEKKGLSIVPLTLYFKKNYVKIEIAVARGKKKHDKREKIKRLESRRQIRKALYK